MSIWIITQHYKPETNAPATRWGSFAPLMALAGHQVHVFTGHPDAQRGVVAEGEAKKPAFHQETLEDVTVHRHWVWQPAKGGTVWQALGQLSFMFSLLWQNLWRTEHKPTAIVVSSPPFFCCFAAWILAARYRVPFIMEVRDLWPGIFAQMGILKEKSLLMRVLHMLEMFLYHRATAVVTVTRGFAEDIASRGVRADKLYVITNGVSDAEWQYAVDKQHDKTVTAIRNELKLNPTSKVVLYIGNHGQAQALGQVLDAAQLMIRRTDVLFLLVGRGADKERLEKIGQRMPNVQFLDAQPKERVWAFYRMATVGLVCLKDISKFRMFIPSKMFEMMAAETPIVGCLQGEGAEILQKSGGAVVVPSEEPEKLAHALDNLVDDTERQKQMGQKGRAFVAEHYRHSHLTAQYLGLLNKITGKS